MSSIRGVNVGGNLFDITDSSNIAPIQLTNFATRRYAEDRCFIMADGLLYRATAEIESGDPIVINGNCRRTTLDEIISVIETDSDLIAPTEDDATSSDDYEVGDEIVRSGILYKVIDAISQGDAFAIGSNIDIAGSLTSQIKAINGNEDAMLNMLGAKNLLQNNVVSQTLNGVTFTVNDDGSIRAVRTTTTTSNATLVMNNHWDNSLIKGKEYILTGCPDGGSNSTYKIKLVADDNENSIQDFGSGGTSFVFDDTIISTSNTHEAQIVVYAGGPLDLTFYPMIRPASVADDTYVPYAKTNRELTERLIYDEQQVAISSTPPNDWKNGTIPYSLPSGYKVGSVTLKTSTGACIACMAAITSNSIIIYARNMGNASLDITVTALILYIKE